MLLISRLKHPYRCCSSYFCYSNSVVHRVVSIVSDGCNQSSIVFFYVVLDFLSMHQRCLQCWQVLFLPPFLILIDCQRRLLCVVISFLVLWSIYLSSSLVLFKKGPEHLTRGIAQVFISFIRFLPDCFVLSSFLVLLRYSFWIFFFQLYLFDSVSLQNAQVFVGFLFSEGSHLVLIWLCNSVSRMLLFISSMAHFECQIPFLCLDCIS